MIEKECSFCGETLSIDKFHKHPKGGGFQAQCKVCNQELSYRYKLKKKYGIGISDYNDMLTMQASGCAICGNPENIAGRRLSVDHCHETGKVRGLLCNLCNIAIGNLHDDPDLLRRAIQYLEDEGERIYWR